MKIGVPTEIQPGELCVALTPATTKQIVKAGLEVLIEAGAGQRAGFLDAEYQAEGATILPSREDVFKNVDVILQMKSFGANPQTGERDLALLRSGQAVIGFSDPLGAPQAAKTLAERGVMAFSMELIPRITRAQSMDSLSSLATIAGYKAVLLAANAAPRLFPRLMTAAGTVAAARVLVIGAGVAGLQAIATAKRLGAIVEAYDVRAAVKEQIESLGAKFVVLDLEAGDAEDKGGYAKKQDEEFYRRQREQMANVVARNDIVITTAAIPGQRSPLLVTADAVRRMALGSVIVDLASERGGNCELTRAGETIVEHGVTILGPLNISSTIPYHASQMYAKNITTLLLYLVKEGKLVLDAEDEVVAGTLVSRDGQVVHPRLRQMLGLTA